MKIIAVIVIIYLALLIKFWFDNKRLLKKLERQLTEEWGQIPKEEYSYEKMDSIPKFYEARKDSGLDVDNITWNDLDMDRIFMLLNHTESSVGEEYLYSMLRKIQYDNTKLEERNRLISFFFDREEERRTVQKKLRMIGKLKEISFFEYVNRVDILEEHNPYLHILCMLLFPLSIISALIPLTRAYSIVIIVGVLIFNIIVYYRRKGKIEVFFNVLSYILRALNFIEEISDLKIEELSPYLKELRTQTKHFRRFRRGAFLVVSKKVSGSMEDVLLDYCRMIFHFDLIKFDFMVKELRNKKENLNRLFEIVGLLDSAIAVASFRTFLDGNYCVPQLLSQRCIDFEVRKVYHPLIIDPVTNSISTNDSILLTGSNASGKSTFIKTLAINAILAQTIVTSPSEFYRANFFNILSSMALRDDIMSQESYYIVEIKSLKRIYDVSGGKIPVLCFVDEVLRGTNTAERIAASGQILKSLSQRNVLCFAATHDIELTHILEKYFKNYHFQEKIENNQVLFDYILHEGQAVSRNAIKLLGMMGYSEEIIEKATEQVNHFLETNTWSTL